MNKKEENNKIIFLIGLSFLLVISLISIKLTPGELVLFDLEPMIALIPLPSLLDDTL